MFCSTCGKQIQENAKFCNYCGAQQGENLGTVSAPKINEHQQNVVDTQIRQPRKESKKKPNIILTLIIVLGVFLLGKFVVAPLMTSDYNNNSDSQNNQIQISTENSYETSAELPNPEYEEILEEAYIVHFKPFFNMETASFVMKQDNGTICCADYGYEDDVVGQWVETVYVPITGYTDAQKDTLENSMKSQYASLESLSCCSVESEMGATYYSVTFTYSDVDKAENYTQLYNAGILQTNTFISMSATEEGLLSQGFIKK